MRRRAGLRAIAASVAVLATGLGRAGPVAPPPIGKPEGRYVSVAEAAARHEWEREHGIVFPKLVRGNPDRKEIALTFDDGPHARFTPLLLDLLRREKVRATFFVVGKMVDAHPELVQQEAADGHEVANHTYDHLRLTTLDPTRIAGELSKGDAAIKRAIGSTTRLYRPPGGEYDQDVIGVTKRRSYVMVLWTDDPGDYADPGARAVERRTLQHVSNGGIVLMHDGVQETMDVLPGLLRRLKQAGYRFVLCSEMARERGVIDQGGPVVRRRGGPGP